MRHIYRIIILLAALILTSMIYVIGILNDTQRQNDYLINNIQGQVYDIKLDFESVYQELEEYKGELSDIDYDDDILDIYNKINDLYETVQTFETDNTTSNTEDKKEETTIVEDKEENPITSEDKKEEQNGNYNNGIYNDLYDAYYGRLYIPDLNINVALYYSYDQYVTDRADSANIFFFRDDYGYTIADHNYQEFAKLLNIKKGIQGFIDDKYMGRIDIECVDVFNGYNIGRYIIDKNGVSAMNRTDYMMYTCTSHSNSKDVLICLWDIV